MLQLKLACESSSAHGLPRVATSGKPVYVRVAWLLVFLLFLGFFVRGLIGLVAKLQSPQVTTSLEASSVRFTFPDVYVCFESPVSGTYAASMDAATVRELDARLNDTENLMYKCFLQSRGMSPESISPETKASLDADFEQQKKPVGFFFPPSLPFQLMVDALAHRAEQSVISSVISYMRDNGSPVYEDVNFTSFYIPHYLRCFRWSLGASVEDKLLRSGTSAGLVLTLMLDGNDTSVPVNGNTVATRVYTSQGTNIYPTLLSDWTLVERDLDTADRRVGIRVFLTPPGEHPTDFAKSYLLGPGRFYAMDVAMTQHYHKPDQFDCLDNPPGVQFTNLYDQTPYSNEYSYSYCYYYEYHRLFQATLNVSGPASPIPWPIGNKKFFMNLTGSRNPVDVAIGCVTANSTMPPSIRYDELAQQACRGRDRCSLLVYDATISSADWPTSTSLSAYLGTTVAAARASAAARGLATPALDFLVANATSSAAAAYVRSNLLKLQIRPSRVLTDRVTYAYGYGFESFIADVGGIMGIYLGMSLLTMCELIELIVDIARLGIRDGDSRRGFGQGSSRPSSAKVEPAEAPAEAPENSVQDL